MPSFCCIVGCGMRSERDKVGFYRIPKVLNVLSDELRELSIERQRRWTRAIKRGNLTDTALRNWRVCSRHFVSGAPAKVADVKNPDWVPNTNLGYVTSQAGTSTGAARYERHKQRGKKLEEVHDTAVHEVSQDQHEMDIGGEPDGSDKASQTEVTMNGIDDLQTGLRNANEKMYALQAQFEAVDMREESFKDNDAKTIYFTGLPSSQILFIVYESVSEYLASHPSCALSPFKQFLLTLIKLRLNFPFKYLSYLFTVSPSTVSKYFYETIDIFYEKFKTLIFWPERHILRKNVPECFKEIFGDRVTVIIDCFEIFTERPSHLLTAAQGWSHYKHHQTVKFLIGITPQGSISFISEAWGGRASDKHITENSGFLNLIQPNDVVLADRGFLIQDSLQVLRAELKIPAFTKGKSQLHPLQLEDTRKLATLRIHVERIIGFLKKKYTILRGPIPISMLSQVEEKSALDKIVTVCSAFINLCPSQIPMN